VHVAEKPNYLNVLLSIRAKSLVPFFGAGASMGPASSPAPAAGILSSPAYAPSASTLAAKLAQVFGLVDPDLSGEIHDLAKVTSYGDVTKARPSLRFVLREELGKDLTVGSIHQVTADLAENLRLIVTTNYDLLLEKAMGKRPFHLVVQGVASDDPPGERILWWPPGVLTTKPPEKLFARELKLDPESADAPIIYKLHGSVLPGNDCFVISESDYVDFLHRMLGRNGIPAFFAKYMHSRSLLFLGYSLADWNVRVLLRTTFFNTKRVATLPHWAINCGVKPLEKKLWEGRGIQVHDISVDEFAAVVIRLEKDCGISLSAYS
jgi:hypothetical protein